jgi:hypothetical protein
VLLRPAELKGEDAIAFATWLKTLFDTGNEGIEDSILRSTKPRSLLRIAASLLSHSIYLCVQGKLEKEALNNGVSYFQSPLLNWTLGGVAKALLQDFQHKGYVLRRLCPTQTLLTFYTQLLRNSLWRRSPYLVTISILSGTGPTLLRAADSAHLSSH